MQFADLKAQYRHLGDAIRQRMDRVLEHGQYIMGPEVGELEKSLAAFTGSRHCISCSSGTDAITMALMAKGVGRGDAVFTTAFTFIATAEAASLLGAVPVFVDVHPRTFNLDPDALERTLIEMEAGRPPAPGIPQGLIPKAVIPVDLFGLTADYQAINRIARKHDLFVLEDGAQSLGAEHSGRKACALADIATTSFFPSKPLGCYGDGGAIFTDDDSVAERLRSIRVHGHGKDKYDNVRLGLNGRLDTLQAAILLAKLEGFPRELASRRRIAERYTDRLRASASILVPEIPVGSLSAWAQYSVLSPDRDSIRERLSAQDIPTMVYYPRPLHLQTAYAHLGYREGALPVSESVSRSIFSLPMHPYLDEKDQDRVFSALGS